MITGLAHACFLTSDLDRAIHFYHDQLGLPIAFEFKRDDGTRYGVYFKLGRRTFIEFFLGTLAERAKDQTYRHICLEVDDLPATVATLRARGVTVSDPKLGTDQSWQAWIGDPDGNAIELHAYTPASWQAPHFA
jgi:catechol 2,3-dioxygenase-like lactoylglutathione lyase family enzyme